MRSWQRCPGGPGKHSRQSPGRFAVSSAGSIYPPDGNGIASGLFYRFWRVLVYMGETQGAAGHLAEEGSRAVRSRSTGRATSSKRRMAPISGLPKRRHDSRPRVIISAPCALEFTPDETLGGLPTPPPAPPPSGASPDSHGNIFAAIQEQLGLKLESAKGPVDVLVIDSVERPSAN